MIVHVAEDAEKTEEDEREKAKAKARGARNFRLMDPDMHALKDKRQANIMLQEELKQSNLRVKCVRQGKSIEDIATPF
jgi:hypothetical protein